MWYTNSLKKFLLLFGYFPGDCYYNKIVISKQKEAPGIMFYQHVWILAAYKNIKTIKLSLIEMGILNSYWNVFILQFQDIFLWL